MANSAGSISRRSLTRALRPPPRAPIVPARCLQSNLTPQSPLRRSPLHTPQCRNIISGPAKKTVQQVAARHRSGPFSPRAAIFFLVAGAGLIFYFRTEKARLERKRIAEATKGAGTPKIGGDFELVDQNGEGFSDGDMKGGFSIVYFGFTHCPDICPDELDKLSKILDLVNATSVARISASSFPNHPPNPPSTLAPPPVPSPSLSSSSSSTSSDLPSTALPSQEPYPDQPTLRRTSNSPSSSAPLLPLFITCDPARDTPEVLKPYLSEFHPGIVGLTGTWQQIKDVCRLYRVYFSTPEGVAPGTDYLVDHSIYFYLMDPEGDFVEAIGRQHTAERAAEIITEHMSDWKDGKKIR